MAESPVMAESIVETRDNPNTSYEKSDWPVGKIGLVFLATFILLVVTPFILMWGFPHSLPDQSRVLTIAPPPPRQQVAPSADLAALSRAGEGAGWIATTGSIATAASSTSRSRRR